MSNTITVKDFKTWQEYWSSIVNNLNHYVSSTRVPEVVTYLESGLALYSYTVEGFDFHRTKNQKHSQKLLVFQTEIQDLLRGTVACYQHRTQAPLAIILRTIFEIRIALHYILRSEDPEVKLDLYHRFRLIEQLKGRKASPYLPDPTPAEWKEVATICHEWFEAGTTNFKRKKTEWTATGLSLRDLASAKHVNLEYDYIVVYALNSKYTHASPLLINTYSKQEGVHCMPTEQTCHNLAIQCVSHAFSILELLCEFFGVRFPDSELAEFSYPMMKAVGGEDLIPTSKP